MKTIQAHGKTFKLGRVHKVQHAGPKLHFGDYKCLGVTAIKAPATCSYTDKAAKSLAEIFGNDDLGDCVIAGIDGHIVGCETANAGDEFIATLSQITKCYSAISGYVPGDPSTDVGCNEVDALNWFKKNGCSNGTKPLGWLAVNAKEKSEVMATVFAFGNNVVGLALPDDWISPFPSASGFVWDVAGAPNPENGHCVVILGYNEQGVIISTWGMLGLITWAALAKYAVPEAGGELYVIITPDQLAKGQSVAPNGMAWTALLTDFDQLGGNIPIPSPAPNPTPPPPAPTPSGAPTLGEAQTWATSELPKGEHAESVCATAVKKGLEANWPK